jgi:hypothetical protein
MCGICRITEELSASEGLCSMELDNSQDALDWVEACTRPSLTEESTGKERNINLRAFPERDSKLSSMC